MKLRTMIVDDEPLACDLLRALLAEHEDIQVVAQCQDGVEALTTLQSSPIDLLFLDVHMPEMGGFDVIERIGQRDLPPTIFVTAYHEYAVRGFDVHAIDYLTKPVRSERLAIALERLRQKIAADAALLTREQFTHILNGLRTGLESKFYALHFFVKEGEKETLIAAEKIDWIEAADYYCCLHVGSRSYMLRESIADLSDKLDPRRFVRIHRSSIVNLDRILEIYREGQSEGSVVLTTGAKLRMSRSGRQKLTALGRG